MKDPIDIEFKTEIDAIMQKVKTVLKNIDDHNPIKEKTTNESEDSPP